MRAACLLVAITIAPSLAAAGGAKKAAKAVEAPATPGSVATTPGACGAKVLPLSEGNTWTYGPVIPPVPVDDSLKRIVPAEPKSIVITVKSVDAKKGADTVVTLEEKVTYEVGDKKVPDERTITSTITCSDKKLDISPESFWFAGEPGGIAGLKVDEVQHLKGTSWQLTKGGIGDGEWREDLAIKWTRVPAEGTGAKPGTGKLELERRFQPQQPENITTKLAVYKAEKLALITTGRVRLDQRLAPIEAPKPADGGAAGSGSAAAPAPAADPGAAELPAGWLTTIWLAENVGVVQTVGPYAHMYQLVDAKLK